MQRTTTFFLFVPISPIILCLVVEIIYYYTLLLFCIVIPRCRISNKARQRLKRRVELKREMLLLLYYFLIVTVMSSRLFVGGDNETLLVLSMPVVYTIFFSSSLDFLLPPPTKVFAFAACSTRARKLAFASLRMRARFSALSLLCPPLGDSRLR